MKRTFLSVLTLSMLWGCTQSELVSREDDRVEMRLASTALSVESVTKTSTRASFDGLISSGNTLTARVLAATSSGTYTTPYADGTMTFSDNGTTAVGFATPQYYPANNNNIYFCGLYPATGWAGTPTTIASLTFDGTQDVMAAPEVFSNKDEAKAAPLNPSNYKQLNFKHLMTQLVIKVVAENQAAIDAWGHLTAITLTKAGGNNPSTKVDVTLLSGTAATGSAFSLPSTPFKFWVLPVVSNPETAFSSQDVELATAPAVAVAYSIVCPVEATGTDDYTLSVSTVNSGTAVSVPVNLKTTANADYTGDTQGKKFEVTLTFKATEIMAQGAVTDWVSDGQGGEVIQ